MKREAGHVFLARLGKKRLRPGGITATNWLKEQANIKKDSKILEVACNMATSAIEIVQEQGCDYIGVDIDDFAIQKALANIEKNGLKDKIKILKADARELPFEDESFDIVINEAMLTMLTQVNKEKCVSEYYRVLRKGGVLLTHDVLIKGENEEKRVELSKSINVNVSPQTKEKWQALFKNAGFSEVESFTGDMTLMSPIGLIKDEGFFNTLRILFNGLKKENRNMFIGMFKTFRKNKKHLGFIATISRK